MEIEVHLFAGFRQGRFGHKVLAFPSGSTVGDICRQLGIAPQEAAILMVNGSAAQWQHPLSAGDTVSLFPAIGGG